MQPEAAMAGNWTSGFRRSAAQCFFGAIGLALLTFICFQLGLDLATTGFAYLILLAILSLMGSFIASGALSLIAVACLTYFFAPPIFDFHVAYEHDVLAIAAFLTTSMIVAGLTTRRDRAEDVLREQTRLLDLTHDTIFVRDMRDVITFWNRGAEVLYGWARAEALGKVTHQLMQTAFTAPLAEINAELLRTGRWEGELVHTKRDGTQVVVASRWSLQRDEQGRPIAVLETNNDITVSRQAAQALQRQASLLEQAHDAIFVWELRKTIVYWYRGAEQLYGYSRDEAIGRASHELLHTVRPMTTSDLEAALERDGEWAGELTHTARDGRRIVVESRHVLMLEADGRRLVLETNRDITERKLAESALRESERRHRYIFQSTGVSIWEQDFFQVKMAIDDLHAGGVRDFRRYFAAHPEFVQQAITMVKVVDVNDVTVRLFAAGSKDELLVSLHKVLLPETREVFVGELIAIAEGRPSFEAETVLQTLKGERLTVLFTISFPAPPVGFERVLVTVTDITERKLAEAERARLGERLRQAEKMEAVGRLAGGVAHDFNNVLSGVLAYGEMLFEEAPENSPRKRHAQNVLTAAARGQALVEQILAYSRTQRGKRVPADICRTVAETIELVRGSLPADIRLNASVPEGSLVVTGDAIQLHQVAMNLCSNAIQAMSGGGTLRVGLETAEVAGDRALSHGALKPGRYVRLTVEDSGCGMDEETLTRIFEPFFTTKEVGQGTGLGLALVHAIVNDLGGVIDVKTAVRQGSTFAIYLPPDESAPPLPAEAEATPPASVS